MNSKDVLGEINSDGDNGGNGLPLPKKRLNELMKSFSFPSWHSIAVNRKPHDARPVRDSEIPFIR
jgi:hypothetical protein